MSKIKIIKENASSQVMCDSPVKLGIEESNNSRIKDFENMKQISNRSLKYHDKLAIWRPFTDYNNNFSEEEGLKMTELLYSMYSVKEQSGYYRIIIKDPVIEKACMAWALTCQEETQKIIKMFKNLKGFVGLCDNDQLALIKYGCVEVYIMRLILQYNFKYRYFNLVNVRLIVE